VHLLNLEASVPASAPYTAKQVLEVRNVSGNGGSIPMDGDSALHSVAYFGDVTASGVYSSLDASRVARVTVGLDGGFAPFKLLDPVIIADVTGNGLISSLDTSRIMQAVVAVSIPEIPPLPTPALTLVSGGPDPKLSIPTDLAAAPGSELEIPVHIDSIVDLTGNGLESADLVLYYDAAVLDVSGVSLGSLLPATGQWSVGSRIDALAGRIFVSVAGTRPLEGFFDGELVKLHATVKSDAPAGASAINLAAGSHDPARRTQLNEGYLTLIPAPTDAANDVGVDGLLTVLPVSGSDFSSQPSAQLVGEQLLIVGTQASDRLIVGRWGTDRVRVRAGNMLLGDFPVPSGIAIDSLAGDDYVVVDVALPTAVAATSGDMIFANLQTAILNTAETALGTASLVGEEAPATAAQDEALLQILAGWNDDSPTPVASTGSRLARFSRR
jgi:hypothetical protein